MSELLRRFALLRQTVRSPGDALLAGRMAVWALALPALKRTMSLEHLVRLMWRDGNTTSVSPRDRQIVDERRHRRQTLLLAAHPIKTMVEKGLRVVLNTDDPPMFSTDLGSEYALMCSAAGWGPDEVRQLCLNGVDAAWLDDAERLKGCGETLDAGADAVRSWYVTLR